MSSEKTSSIYHSGHLVEAGRLRFPPSHQQECYPIDNGGSSAEIDIVDGVAIKPSTRGEEAGFGLFEACLGAQWWRVCHPQVRKSLPSKPLPSKSLPSTF